jgi:hypothetical protein
VGLKPTLIAKRAVAFAVRGGFETRSDMRAMTMSIYFYIG